MLKEAVRRTRSPLAMTLNQPSTSFHRWVSLEAMSRRELVLLCGGQRPISGCRNRAWFWTQALHVRCVSKVLILHVSGSHDLHKTGKTVGQTDHLQRQKGFHLAFTGRSSTTGHESAQIAAHSRADAGSYLAKALDTRHPYAYDPFRMCPALPAAITRSGYSRLSSQSDLPLPVLLPIGSGRIPWTPGRATLVATPLARVADSPHRPRRLDGGKPPVRQFRAR